jgi:hypothetical protein
MINNPAIKLNSTSKSNLVFNNIVTRIHMVLALIVIAWMNNGFFTYAMPYVPNFIRYGLYFAWLGLALVGNKRFFEKFIKQTWPLLLFFCYMLLISLFVETDLVVYIKSISYLIMVYSIFLYYFNSRHIKFQKLLSVFFILDCIAVGINTYIQLQINPLLVRYLATGMDTRERLLGTEAFPGIGSYGYFYALVAIIILLAFLFLNQRKRKSLLLLAIVVTIALLIQATYTIAILFTFIFISLLIILRYGNKYTVISIVVLGIISLLIFQGVFASMFSQLADIQGIPYEVSVRFDELAGFFSGNDVSGTDLNSRQGLYLQSVDAFANNLLTGTVVNDSSVYRAGGHSAWLDLLATFGLFSIPFFIFIYNAYKYCKNRVPIMFKSFVKVYWLYFVCLGFINTLLFAPIFTIWFLFLPVFMSAFFKEEKFQYNCYSNKGDNQ